MAKRVIDTAHDAPLHVGLELEGLAYGLLRQTHDFREGVEAFVEKRQSALQRGREPRYDSASNGRYGAFGRADAVFASRSALASCAYARAGALILRSSGTARPSNWT